MGDILRGMKKPLILALTLLIPALLTSCTIDSTKSSQEKRLEELESVANQVDTPTIERTNLEYAKAAVQSGNLIKAEYYYSQLLESKPDSTEYLFDYSEVLRKSGKCPLAMKGYDKVLAIKPNDIDTLEGKGLCLLASSKNPQAADIFTQILAADPTRWKSLNAAGLIFASDKKFTEASQYFNAAAKYSNDNPAVLNNQGLAKALTGNFKDGIKILEDALIKTDDSSNQKRSIALNLALIYGISGNMDLAEKTARPYLTEPQLYNNMGVYAELAKDKELAKTYLNKALQDTPVYYDRAWDNLERVKAEK